MANLGGDIYFFLAYPHASMVIVFYLYYSTFLPLALTINMIGERDGILGAMIFYFGIDVILGQ